MIADLHCHYAMHLLPGDRHPHGVGIPWFERVRDELQAFAAGVAGQLLNNPGWLKHWRVDLEGLEKGGVGIVCSVLYWPPAEIDLDRHYGDPPEAGYFGDLQHQLESVEADLAARDQHNERHVIVRRAADLDDETRIRFVPCVEGGFHLGSDEDGTLEDNVAWLSEHGVLYVTLAHLFFRGVAANAPAIPSLTDRQYDHVFPQEPGIGLTHLGRAAVDAMYRHKVLVDISHMREDAIADTFERLRALDDEHGADPRDFPVIASHVGIRAAERHAQAYNLTPETVERIKERDGLIGLILAQHQLGETRNATQSREVLCAHIDAIAAITGDHRHTAIGSDLDGFIKPTLSGVEWAFQLGLLEKWVRARYPADADAILYDNARRVVRRALAAREAA
jgi:microsomal dipeptidase-like Zn-dependent dipeptidase